MDATAAAKQTNVLAPVESIFLAIPGGGSPIGRVAIGAAAGAGVAYFLRPAMSFHSNGRPREWIVTHASDPEATLFPWWAYVAMPAVLFGILL